jgi:hypothetical protein
MDPISLIVTAVVTGAAAALKDAANETIKDAYHRLRALLKAKFAGKPGSEAVLEGVEGQPDVWQKPLEAALSEAGADGDEQVLRAAQQLLALTDPQGTAAGKYRVTIDRSKGIVVGDHATVTMKFDGDE